MCVELNGKKEMGWEKRREGKCTPKMKTRSCSSVSWRKADSVVNSEATWSESLSEHVGNLWNATNTSRVPQDSLRAYDIGVKTENKAAYRVWH